MAQLLLVSNLRRSDLTERLKIIYQDKFALLETRGTQKSNDNDAVSATSMAYLVTVSYEATARDRGPWPTCQGTSTGRAPRQIEAGGATPAPRMGGCATARALEIRRVFENRFTTSNVMAQGP